MTGPRARLSAHENSLRRRLFPYVREGQQHAAPAARAPDLPRASGEHELRRPAALAAHLELAPAHAEPEPGAERLQRRLLRREARREVRHRVAPRAAVRDLLLGDDAPEETVLPALDHLAHARNVDQVHADAGDGHVAVSARSAPG